MYVYIAYISITSGLLEHLSLLHIHALNHISMSNVRWVCIQVDNLTRMTTGDDRRAILLSQL